MAKNTKKNLKLRKRMRRTSGIICLITALLVAAIPVPESVAEGAVTSIEGDKLRWESEAGEDWSINIPIVPVDCKDIYTTGDGTFQFACVKESATSTNVVAIILGYNSRNLVNNKLIIPDTVNVYAKYNNSQGSFSGYVAVNRLGFPLFYEDTVKEPELDENDEVKTDPETGAIIYKDVIIYKPCYYSDRNAWEENDIEEFFYYQNNYPIPADRNNQDTQWMKGIEVQYIGNQTIAENLEPAVGEGRAQGWKIATDQDGKAIHTTPSTGIFANNTNIQTLDIGDNLLGIGNYAFYGCGGLNSVTFGNGLKEIGKGAFLNCINLTQVNIPFLSNITFIADETFKNCRNLTKFVMPASVQYIYDRAFEGCVSLVEIDISGETQKPPTEIESLTGKYNVQLMDIGYYVFKGCTSLQRIRIPYSIGGNSNQDYTLVLNNFKDCNNLFEIEIQAPPSALESNLKIDSTTKIDGDNYSLEEFYNMQPDGTYFGDVHETFYFECIDKSEVHKFTKEHSFVFKYLDEERYEVIKKDKSNPDVKLTYEVNDKNELLYFEMTGVVDEIEIPEVIGPYGISSINEGSFSNNCHLKKIIIPSTVLRINKNAFKGCHELKHVIFSDASKIEYIGEDAFATQMIDSVLHEQNKNTNSVTGVLGCTKPDFLEPDKTTGVADRPVLTFTGDVGSNIVPFAYAMNASSNINAGAQPLTYITYYSGWPTNLEIRYNSSKGTAELVDYPTSDELTGGTKYTKDKYPYMDNEYYTTAAKTAFEKYKDYIQHGESIEYEPTIDQWDIINAAINVVVPEGVTGIATGLFSDTYLKSDVIDDKKVETITSVDNNARNKPDTEIKSIRFNSVNYFEPYTIYGCSSLESVTIKGGASEIDRYAFASSGANQYATQLKQISFTSGGGKIGEYAFLDQFVLTDVSISPEVYEVGTRPFAGCLALDNISFGGGPYFVCENSIVFELDNGTKKSIVQCLQNRSKTVAPAELSGVSEIYDEAFMDCDKLGSIDFSQSSLTRVSNSAFKNMDSLFSVMLPNTCRSISANAFKDCSIQFVEIPGSVTFIEPSAFNTNTNSTNYKQIEFLCEAGSAAETYANEYENIVITDRAVDRTFSVRFYDYPEGTGAEDATMVMVDEQLVKMGESAVPPTPVGREGYVFKNWSMDYTNVSRDMDIAAVYEKASEVKYKVTFYDWNDTVLYTQEVAPGGNAITPQDPVRSGYKFTGWRPALTNITKDTDVYAMYEPITNADGNGGTGGNGGNSGTGGNGGITGDGTLYTLTVKNGSGSGSYVAGAQIPIIANEPAKGQRFDEWKIESGTPTLVSSTMGATFLTMPAGNVIVSATFEKDPNYSGSGSGSGSNSGGSNSGSNTTKPGTVIVIDKNGLSNTGVVSGTVNGSSDNFVIKITEDKNATEAILRALKAEYGSLDNLKYFPMDISLYDSTGKTKITDTTGLSIKITLPLPDSLIKYAGNNKVASVQNSKLDKLSTKFATIDGVSCVTFTAEHFSPYVIYVDTGNLISAGTTDESPKTGDMHPKWFLVFGLTCLAAFLFLKKDKQVKKVLV